VPFFVSVALLALGTAGMIVAVVRKGKRKGVTHGDPIQMSGLARRPQVCFGLSLPDHAASHSSATQAAQPSVVGSKQILNSAGVQAAHAIQQQFLFCHGVRANSRRSRSSSSTWSAVASGCCRRIPRRAISQAISCRRSAMPTRSSHVMPR
jgi:hypothetical protein